MFIELTKDSDGLKVSYNVNEIECFWEANEAKRVCGIQLVNRQTSEFIVVKESYELVKRLLEKF